MQQQQKKKWPDRQQPKVYVDHTGKIPPQAIELEQAVLGALMLDKVAMASVAEIITQPDVFYKESHQVIFRAIQELYHMMEPVDILSVVNRLREHGSLEVAGGAYYITQLTNRVASAANIEYHSRIILQMYIKRQMIRITGEAQNNAYDDGYKSLELIEEMEMELFNLSNGVIKKSSEPIHQIVSKVIKQIEVASNTKGVIEIPTGFRELDECTGGWQRGDLIILAARPGMGKSALAMRFARHLAVKYKKGAVFFSLEMSSISLVFRLVSQEAGLNSEKLKRGEIHDSEWAIMNQRTSALISSPLQIDDTPGLNLYEFKAKCRRLVTEQGVSLIVIDYLQLMMVGHDSYSGNREQEISFISRSLKAIAKELNVPIIALSQLSRAVEARGGAKRPKLSDLRESGAIEQDADMVLFIYRPEYYGETQRDDMQDARNLAEIIIAKNRNGALKTVDLGFIGHLTLFCELEEMREKTYVKEYEYGPVTTPNPNVST